MAERSLSIALILNDPEDDLFSVIAEDKGQDMLVDVTDSYEVQSAHLPDGRIGVVIVAKLEATNRIDPYTMPDQEGI